MIKAVAYYRTSSATNVGSDKDSKPRQRDAVSAYAEANGHKIVGEYYDAAVRGADSVCDRPGFAQMLDQMASLGATVILVENAGRFARDIVVQLTGYEMLKARGITVIPVDCPYHFLEDTPTAKLIRSVLGAVSAFEKDMLVDKLKKARERKRRETGRCEGPKPAPAEARQMATTLRKEGLSLREVAAKLSAAGYRGPCGQPYGPESVKRMVK